MKSLVAVTNLVFFLVGCSNEKPTLAASFKQGDLNVIVSACTGLLEGESPDLVTRLADKTYKSMSKLMGGDPSFLFVSAWSEGRSTFDGNLVLTYPNGQKVALSNDFAFPRDFPSPSAPDEVLAGQIFPNVHAFMLPRWPVGRQVYTVSLGESSNRFVVEGSKQSAYPECKGDN
jgi:hypothetical protein